VRKKKSRGTHGVKVIRGRDPKKTNLVARGQQTGIRRPGKRGRGARPGGGPNYQKRVAKKGKARPPLFEKKIIGVGCRTRPKKGERPTEKGGANAKKKKTGPRFGGGTRSPCTLEKTGHKGRTKWVCPLKHTRPSKYGYQPVGKKHWSGGGGGWNGQLKKNGVYPRPTGNKTKKWTYVTKGPLTA